MIWVIALAILAALLLLGVWFLQHFYAKATLNSAIVRTGFGGMRVILNGGCLSLPMIHQTQRVIMGAVSFAASRSNSEALMTKDQLRADVLMEFEFRVSPTVDGVAAAAQSLGSRIERGGDVIEEVLKGPLVDAMQNAAARRTLDEIHQDRRGFTDEIQASVTKKAEKLGLFLSSASLISVDQSDLAQFDDKNAFVAQGMRRHAELISEQRRERVRIETETDIAVSESALAKQQRTLEIERSEREASIAQKESLDLLEAESRTKTEQAKTRSNLESERSRIEAEQKVAAAKVENNETLRRIEMSAVLALEETKVENDTQLARLRTAEYETQAAEEAARALVVLAAEDVQARKERAVVAREHETAQLRMNKDIDLSTAQAKNDADTLATKTEAEAKAVQTIAAAEKVKSEAEAASRAAHISAENSMSREQTLMRLEERKLDRMPEIMTQMMKPVEKIESIKINQIAGLGGHGATPGESGSESAFGSAMDQILGMAVRLPAMKQMGEEIGLDFDANLAGRTADYANRLKAKTDKK